MRTGRGLRLAFPPCPRQHTAAEVSEHIFDIAGDTHQMRPDDLAQHRPDHQVKSDFSRVRETVVFTQAQFSLQPEYQRERAGNQQGVVELPAEKWRMGVRLDEPAVQRIQRATRYKQRIAPVAKPPHNKAIIANPAATASANFKSKIIAQD